MGGNAQPQFTRQGNVGSAEMTAANTNSDGTGNIGTPTMYVLFHGRRHERFVRRIR